MELVLDASLRGNIAVQGEASYPHECCGFLLGRQPGEQCIAEALVAAENQRTDALHNRYLISPLDYLKIEKRAEAAGQQVLGFYHSHPDHSARPSAFDLEHAWPNIVYVIVAVQSGKAEALRAFRLAADRSHFERVPVQIPPHATPARGAELK